MKFFIVSISLILCLVTCTFAENLNAPNPNENFFKDYYLKGLNFAIAGNFEQAQLELSKGMYPNHLMMMVLNDARNGKLKKEVAINIFIGYKHAYENNWEQMIVSFNNAVKEAQSYIPAYLIRANMLYDIESFDLAIADFTKVIQLDQNNLQAYLGRGSSYGGQGNYDLAISDYNKAVEINPNFGEAYKNRAVAYFGKKDYDKAWTDVHKAELLGYKVPADFLDELKKASGRQN